MLQQHLPLAVLKPVGPGSDTWSIFNVATAPTACGIETQGVEIPDLYFLKS